ncbi:hypothetical protein FKW77_007048 [Venturia effusa]|uniref:BTB domain-containing protein n=1 Tax=Venturia effusa TaxID=50376 RepID=A0A517LJ26_9PEZI|nr:hypothetical protein FKW77_007048 [Venturia effusa]
MAWEPATQPARLQFCPVQPVQQSQSPNLDFLDYAVETKADLTVFVPGTEGGFTFQGLDYDAITQSCPLLGYSFEGRGGGLHHSMEATSIQLITRFLRFLHTGDYITFDESGQEEPCSLLLHAELCRLGDLFDVDTLKVQAHYNVIRTTEMACSSPQAPEDLVPFIRFIYEQLGDGYEKMIDTMLHYCIACFLQHRLGQNEEFKRLAYEVRQFHTDLCRTNFKRGFEDEGSSDVIQLPTKENTRIEQTALGDFLYFMHSDTPAATPRFGSIHGSPEPSYAMVIRPRHPAGRAKIEESDTGSESEWEGFSLVEPSQQLHVPFCPAPAVEHSAKQPAQPSDLTSFEDWAIYEVDERHDVQTYSKVDMYKQPDVAGSNATIMLRTATSNASQTEVRIEEDDSLGYDSEWSVVDKPECKFVNFA